MGAQTFYQLVAVLLPALLFGGLLTDRLKPPPRDEADSLAKWAGIFGYGTGGLFFLQAEGLALAGSFRPLTTSARWVVVIAVGLAAALIFIAAILPWVRSLSNDRHRRSLTALFIVVPVLMGAVLPSSVIIPALASEEERAEVERSLELEETVRLLGESSHGLDSETSPDIRRMRAGNRALESITERVEKGLLSPAEGLRRAQDVQQVLRTSLERDDLRAFYDENYILLRFQLTPLLP